VTVLGLAAVLRFAFRKVSILRFLRLVPLTVGIIQPWLADTPNILVNEKAEVFAVLGDDGRIVLSLRLREGFTRGVWVER
jgi:hypothetical protein